MTTADGVTLAGRYVPSTNGAAVIVRHGSGSQRTATEAQAAVLAAHGYGVLQVDARGHGNSAGTAMDLGWWGESDTAAAVDLLASRPDVEPGRIGVLGLSMGGEEAVVAAAPTPVLLVAAGEVPDEGRVGERLVAASPGTVQLWVVPGAGHTGGLAAQPQEWEQRVIGFLGAALLSSASATPGR